MAARKKKVSKNQLSFDFDSSGSKSASRSKKKKAKKSAVKPAAKKKTKAKFVATSSASKKVAPVKRSAISAPSRKRRGSRAATAESMAAQQRDISVSEFFAKNRHLLGFDNPRKALLTAVKEAVDNSMDACEEAHILPDIIVTIKPVKDIDDQFLLTVIDNGPGIVKAQVPNIFARLLYGSKFHTLKMSRGQQGIGISAAGMYGLITTGAPVQIITKTGSRKPAQHYHVQIDTSKNKPEVVLDEECDFDLPHGTSVTITLQGKYQKGRQSVDDYIAQTAMANPHATIIYNTPDGNQFEYARQSKEMPFIPVEIKPHPYGVELGILFKMARDSSSKTMSEFLRKEFSRVSPPLAAKIAKTAKLSSRLRPKRITLKEARRLHESVNGTKMMAPSGDCIGPIGAKSLEEGIRRVVDADFYATCTRKPSVYRGNPFLIEAAIAYGFVFLHPFEDGNGRIHRFLIHNILSLQKRNRESHCFVYISNYRTNRSISTINSWPGPIPVD